MAKMMQTACSKLSLGNVINLISIIVEINNVTTNDAGIKLMAKMMQMACSKLSLGNIIILKSIINNVTTNEAEQSS
jgi:hypothetical protein